MTADLNPHPANSFHLPEAARFWEPRRLLYNAILTLVVLLWIALTWPHFRPALTLGSLEAFLVLGLGANLCYCAAYLPDFFMQAFLSASATRRARWILFILGTLLALLLENYWIGDEVYPFANEPPRPIFGGTMPHTTIATNMNFPAPLAVLGFLAAAGIFFLGTAAILIFWFSRKANFARKTALTVSLALLAYFALLLGFSAASHTSTLARGQEKYFCEIDCHLAYSIINVSAQPSGHYTIVLRTRFDETTTSPSRPKDAPLTPSPREIRLIDTAGHQYAPARIAGTPLLTPLTPADSYSTELEFDLPPGAMPARLLLQTTPQWPDHLVIGDENSFLHAKTYFAL